MKFSCIVAILCLPVLLLSQGQNNIWYFGYQAGIDFNTADPTSITSPMITSEGSAVVSDPSGNLLFYTSGDTVWDRNHNIMPNGTELTGGFSSTQAALIVPLPNSYTKYYLFTTEHHILTNGGLSYSIIDMTLNNGFGDIVPGTKNTLLLDRTAEKNVAALHENGKDIWIITHKLNSKEFVAFLLTSNGLDPSPVISSVGSFHDPGAFFGPIKIAHNRTKLATSSPIQDIIELFDFDPSTGVISNPFNINELFSVPQSVDGIEFSPNDSLLYLGTRGLEMKIHQIDLKTGVITTLKSIKGITVLDPLQMGPNNKIYVSRRAEYLDVIHRPNEKGFLCLYQDEGQILLPGTRSREGLPNFVPYSFYLDTNQTNLLGEDIIACNNTALTLSVNIPPNCQITSFFWSTGSTEAQIEIHDAGTYWVAIEGNCTTLIDTIIVDFIDCPPIVHFDFEECSSYMHDGSNMDYSEFLPDYPNILPCTEVSSSNVYRDAASENKHSCTVGVNSSIAMCVSSHPSCEYEPGNSASVVFEANITPPLDSIVTISGLEFFQKGPNVYSWIDGASGLNNYPQKFGIRILKNGVEIFRESNLNTSLDWKLESFNFIDNDLFSVNDSTVFRFEILPYCLVGHPSNVTAWDIDEIKIFGGCHPVVNSGQDINGQVITIDGRGVPNVEIKLSKDVSFSNSLSTITDAFGNYKFPDIDINTSYYVTGIRNYDFLNGVTTSDLLKIQKHLLGFETFETLEQYIAADVNRDNKVSAIDLLELRKLILGIHETFPGNTSWRFCSTNQNMISTNISEFEDLLQIPSHGQSETAYKLFGIKIGDLTGDVKL